MKDNVYIYIFVMAAVTYAVRLIPFTIIRKEIKNVYIKSFLYYVPFVTLAVMTFPSIINSTQSIISGIGGFIVAIFLAYIGKSLFVVSILSCITVFIIEFILSLF